MTEPVVAAWRSRGADVVWGVHTLIVAFFLVAWALPWRTALWIAVVGGMVMQVQWWLNDDLCVLTKVERVLRGLPAVPDRADEQGNFISSLAVRVCGRPLPRRWTTRLTYAVLWGGSSVAAARLAWS